MKDMKANPLHQNAGVTFGFILVCWWYRISLMVGSGWSEVQRVVELSETRKACFVPPISHKENGKRLTQILSLVKCSKSIRGLFTKCQRAFAHSSYVLD